MLYTSAGIRVHFDTRCGRPAGFYIQLRLFAAASTRVAGTRRAQVATHAVACCRVGARRGRPPASLTTVAIVRAHEGECCWRLDWINAVAPVLRAIHLQTFIVVPDHWEPIALHTKYVRISSFWPRLLICSNAAFRAGGRDHSVPVLDG